MPEYDGGEDALLDFLETNLKYDYQLLQKAEEMVYVQFEVDTTGQTLNHRIIKSDSRDELNKEALRVAKLVQFRYPAYQGKKAVQIVYNLPVTFRVPNKTD